MHSSWARRAIPFLKQYACTILGNAGTAIRPLTAALSLTESEFIIDGDEAMRERPIGPLVDALKALGLVFNTQEKQGFPLKLQGGAFSHSTTTLDGSLSSQYLTALLMAYRSLPRTLPSNRRGPGVAPVYRYDVSRARSVWNRD